VVAFAVYLYAFGLSTISEHKDIKKFHIALSFSNVGTIYKYEK